MVHYDREQLDENIEKALHLRLRGNEKFKAGDLSGALLDYHSVLLQLRGLDSPMQQVYGMPNRAPEPPIRAIEEREAEELRAPPELTKPEMVKQALLNTYLNSAAIHIKLERFKRALDCAQQAQKIDEKNPKAAFREAQARIGLGEIQTGKNMLEELQKKQPDPAISAALQKLASDDKAREAKKAAQFKGMFYKNRQCATGATPAAGGNSAGSNGSATTKGDAKLKIDAAKAIVDSAAESKPVEEQVDEKEEAKGA
ncbi:hypothetical protein JCM1841_001537 [Sporobolomyces salmonicolor]